MRILVGFAGLLVVILFPSWPIFAADRTIEFNRDIRPILSDKCYRCHGSDATAKGIPLRLDSEAAATADLGDNKHAIVPGNLESSQLVRRITAEDEAVRMPPVYSGLKLTDREIETLRSWIAQGAKWQLHWSFIPPKSSSTSGRQERFLAAQSNRSFRPRTARSGGPLPCSGSQP